MLALTSANELAAYLTGLLLVTLTDPSGSSKNSAAKLVNNKASRYETRRRRGARAAELTQTTSHFARAGRWRARRGRPTRVYLDFKVREVERRPEERAEVRYGGDFPPRLDLLHGNSTSPGHFRSGAVARLVTLTSESGFSGAPRRIRNITNPRKVGSAVRTGLLPSPPHNLLQSEPHGRS